MWTANMWTKNKPTEEGWYFWKARKNTQDRRKFFAYYVSKENDGYTCWADGAELLWPDGGWWLKNVTYLGV